MSVNLKVEDTCDNPYLASYNSCIDLGVERISRIFNFNIEENENHYLLTSILKGNMGPDSIPEIQHIVQKLECNEELKREDQVVLGMAYLFYQQIAPAKKEHPQPPSLKEAHRMPHKKHIELLQKSLLKPHHPQNLKPHAAKRPSPLVHGSSRLRDMSGDGM